MAIKGLGYTKTTWAFQERPVASAKLNMWDDRIEAALELVHFLLSHAWGGGDGVLRGVAEHDLKVEASDPAGLAVVVQPGAAFIGRYPYRLSAVVTTPSVAPPSIEDRIDLVQARLAMWDVNVKAGEEHASPEAPEPDADCIALAELHLRPGMSVITNADDSVNGYIVDAREFL
jgi:hypothetical protein